MKPVLPSAASDPQLPIVFQPAPRSADDLFAVLRQLGLRRITRFRLTNNRNVMVSHGDGELRIHKGYLTAPDDILSAIVAFVEGLTRRERAAGRKRLLAHPIDVGGARPRRREVSHPDDLAAEQRLTRLHAELNQFYFEGTLRPLCVRVSRRMRRRLGHYVVATAAGDPAEIAISRRHIRRDGWEQALRTLLHEMVHQWQDESGFPIDHGSRFRAKAREVGIPAAASRTVAA